MMMTQREDRMNDETPLRLTDHELLALLAINQTPSAGISREVFRLSPVAGNELLEQAGITTLLVRGLAEVSGDDIVPVEKGAIVAAVVSTAEEWLEVALVTPKTDHVLFAAGSKEGAILLNLSRYGVHEVQPVDPGAGMLQLGLKIARHYLESGVDGYPAAAMIKHYRQSGPPLTAHLKVEADNAWTLATGADGADKTEAIDSADAFRSFESALTF
jgi:hypothetical protein